MQVAVHISKSRLLFPIVDHDVIGFVKRGLPNTSNLPTLTINNVKLKTAIPLKFGQQCVPTWVK